MTFFWCHTFAIFVAKFYKLRNYVRLHQIIWDPKWSEVGTKIGPKIDLNFGRPILQKTL